MKNLLILLLVLGTMSLSGCMGLLHGDRDHTDGYSDHGYDSRYNGRTGGGHSH